MAYYGKTNPTLQWNANPEVDLAGYKVYYGQTLPLTANVDVGNVTTYTFPGNLITPIQKWYYFTITSYDTSGNESGQSSVVRFYVSDPYTRETVTKIVVKRG